MFVKQARQRKIPDAHFFNNYPYCKLELFTFDVEALKADGKVFRDEEGLHFIQSLEPEAHPPRHSHCGTQQEGTLLNGWGVSVFNDGKIFEGVYHDSYPCGLGYELLPNGNTYVGAFKEGNKCGKGTYYWFSSGEMYTGEWLGGLPHGEGKYLSGDLYSGNFCNGMKYGSGEEWFQNGDQYIGDYVNGVADGYGEYYWADGSIYKGDFKHGVRHGYGIWNDKKETEIFSGCYRMDMKEGFGVYDWVGKQIYKGQFKEDFREGYGKLYRVVHKFAADVGSEEAANLEELLYEGMWQKGKQKADAVLDEEAKKELSAFINDRKLGNHKKQRIGHQNCIPKQESV